MPLRRRIALVAAASVAVAVAIAVVISYLAVRDQLIGQTDSELTAQAYQIERNLYSISQDVPTPSASLGGPTPYIQFVLSGGTPQAQVIRGTLTQPGVAHAQQVAAGQASPYFATIDVGGTRLRQYTFAVPAPRIGGMQVAFQIARPLAAVDNVLSTLKWILLAVFLLVVMLAALLARLATHRVLRPLGEMTATAEAIAETEDLERRIAIREDDEVGQLARRFNQMLERLARSRAALDESVSAQRQLVADASHELRTPVTSLRTNIEILIESGSELDAEERRRLLLDVVEQSEELSTLVSDLIEVARGDLPDAETEYTRLDRLVEEALQRARRNSPQTPLHSTLTPVVVPGDPERLTRAINNLLDNAARHTQPGTAVEVSVDAGGVIVRDHGAGLAEADLPHVFDRFYRGAGSRARQGSGLGLAIVKQVAEQHGGSVEADNAPDGGAIFRLRLPTVAVDEHPDGSATADDPGVAGDSELAAQ